ncbi:MAG: prepilin-type N-terminal cleavage/methylation domain-containing protein [Verrucomicrobia bacterium]|nr:prepilin-type N-terminal cleavage/methylation domain-containing protein [Verrucomicrobiota bacterium]
MHLLSANASRMLSRAFSLIEVVVAMAIASIILMALYLGISGGFGLMNATRENLRATQIMVEKLESIRLYNWAQLNNLAFLPDTFVDGYFPAGTNTGNSVGSAYYGTVTIGEVPFTELSYATNMRMVTIEITWTNGTIPRVRQMSTFVSQYGLQRYVIQ